MSREEWLEDRNDLHWYPNSILKSDIESRIACHDGWHEISQSFEDEMVYNDTQALYIWNPQTKLLGPQTPNSRQWQRFYNFKIALEPEFEVTEKHTKPSQQPFKEVLTLQINSIPSSSPSNDPMEFLSIPTQTFSLSSNDPMEFMMDDPMA